MDEERAHGPTCRVYPRSQVRVACIKHGFLDRTGDEFHTSMEGRAMVPRGEDEDAPWISAYEDRNVDIGFGLCGLQGRAQRWQGDVGTCLKSDGSAMLKAKIGIPKQEQTALGCHRLRLATLHAMQLSIPSMFWRGQDEIKTGRARGSWKTC